MAKKTMSWAWTNEGILTVTHKDAGDKTVDFNVTELFPDFKEYTEIQQNVICYGIKQKLADSVAVEADKSYTANERIVTMSNTFSRLKDGIWSQKSGERETPLKKVNALEKEGRKFTDAELALLKELGLKK